MRAKLAALVGLMLLLSTGVAGLDAVINPANPDDITLNSSNSYEVTKSFDGSASQGSSLSYSWNNVDSAATASGPAANFTFSRDSSASNTIRLTVSNGTHSDIEEVTQVVRDVPNVSITATSSTSINTGESVSFSSSVTNTFDTPVTYAWQVDGTNVSAGSSFTYTFDQAGTYSVTLKVTDQAGNSAVSASTSVSVSSDSPGGDGGSGGGTIDVGPPADRPGQHHVIDRIPAGGRATVDIEKAEQFGVRRISIAVTTPVSDVEISVMRQDGKPASISVDTPGKAYRYMNITARNLDQNATANATIQFDVNKSWIRANDINTSTVQLQRYTDGAWSELPTDYLDSTATKYIFNATTPGFSYFAVSGHATSDQEPTATCGDGLCNGNETWQSCSTDCTPPQQVQEAQDALENASSVIGNGTAGYEQLQRARQAFNEGNYQQAAELAEAAWQTYQEAQKPEGTQTAPSGMVLPIVVAIIIVAGIVLVYWNREHLRDLVQERSEPDEGNDSDAEDDGSVATTSKAAQRDVEQRLGQVSTRVREAKERGDLPDADTIDDLLNQASDAVKDDNHGDAAALLDQVEERLADGDPQEGPKE